MSQTQNILTEEVMNRAVEFARAPIDNPEIMPNMLPLIMGAVVMELYFGKYKEEALGWNTSVGNAVIWISTGISLLMTESMSQPEMRATYALIAVGGFVAFMDFHHIWPASIAFRVSSSAIVYTLAWTLVMIVKLDYPLNQTTLAAAGVFFVAINIIFKFMQGLEKNEDETFEI